MIVNWLWPIHLAAVQSRSPSGARNDQRLWRTLRQRQSRSIIPNLQLKLGYECITEDSMRQLTNVARYVSEIANVNMPVNQPYVGNAAFAHKGGIHVSAIMRDSSTYEHIVPELVGNKQRVLVSELAGQSNIVSKAQELGLDRSKQMPIHVRLLRKSKTWSIRVTSLKVQMLRLNC